MSMEGRHGSAARGQDPDGPSGRYEYGRNCSYNQCDVGLEDVRWTLRNIYVEK